VTNVQASRCVAADRSKMWVLRPGFCVEEPQSEPVSQWPRFSDLWHQLSRMFSLMNTDGGQYEVKLRRVLLGAGVVKQWCGRTGAQKAPWPGPKFGASNAPTDLDWRRHLAR